MVLTWTVISHYLTDPFNTVLILSFWTDMSRQTKQTQIKANSADPDQSASREAV